MALAKVSILIPTLNGEDDLQRLLPALDAQSVEGLDVERVAIDSSSVDGTPELLRGAGFDVHTIERSEFGHGRTRNELARRSSGAFLLYLSQDAVPTAPDFVQRMLAPFADDRVGGATARVLANPGDDALTARTALSVPEASTKAATRVWEDPARYDEMSGPERTALLRFNNVASCVRRTALDEVPFPEIPFGEDFAWAARVMARGWALHHAPEAAVEHAHRYGPREAYRRYLVDAVFLREFHGFAVRPGLLSVLRGFAYELREDWRYVRRTGAPMRDLLRAPALRAAQTWGQYVGSRGDGEAWREARRRGALEVLPDGSSRGPATAPTQ
ncbi:MAG: glycosyltransferase [Planctomycetota bacterium]